MGEKAGIRRRPPANSIACDHMTSGGAALLGLAGGDRTMKGQDSKLGRPLLSSYSYALQLLPAT